VLKYANTDDRKQADTLVSAYLSFLGAKEPNSNIGLIKDQFLNKDQFKELLKDT